MNTLFWNVFGMPFVLLSDLMAVIALLSAALVVLSTVSQLITGYRGREIVQLWKAALGTLICGGAGFFFMISNHSLPASTILGFSPLLVGILLLSSFFVLVLAAMLPSWMRTMR